MPEPESSLPNRPHEARIGSIERRVDAHDIAIATLSATVERNEAVSQKSRDELSGAFRSLSENFARMESEQKDMPVLVSELHRAIVGTVKQAGIAEDVRGLKARQNDRAKLRDAILGGLITLIAGIAGSLLYFAVTGHGTH